nr:12518_t:CDS:2 [Entrophospora candida]
MAPIHTLNSGSTVAENFQGRGYKLDSTRECELESERNELLIKTEFFANKCSDFRNAKVLAETRSDELAKELKSKNEKILRLRKKLNRITDAKTRNDSNMKQLKEEIKQLQSENTNLVSQGALKELSLTGYQTKYYKKMEEANSFQSRIESLEEKLFSAQKDSSLKASGIDSLKSKITELERMKDELSLKVSELEHLKSEDISEPTVGGDNEKNTQSNEQSSITKSDDISAISEPIKNLSQYFVRRKNMDQAGKFDTIIPDHTDDKSTSIPEEPVIRGSSPSVDTEIISKVSDEIDISKTNNNILVQPENHTSSLIESHPQISVGGIEAIPAVARTLMSPLSAYICLILLIIALLYKMSSQDNINPNWQKIENDVKTKLIKFLQSDEESISLDINSAIEYAFYLYYLKKIINEN